MGYSVRSLKVGEADVPGPVALWMSDWDRWRTLWFQVVVIQGEGVTALVNSGPPADLAELNERWRRRQGGRAGMRRTDDEAIEAVLERVGLRPPDVTHLLLTPLQLYTTANIPLFTNAQICMTKRGWTHYHTTHEHPHDARWTSIPRDVLVHLVTDAWVRVRLLEDEDEVTPGLRTWWSGAHHRASMVVEVDTPDGVVAISDTFFVYENVEGGPPLGISESLEESIRARQRAQRAARHVIPLYDPEVFNRYPDGIVSAR